MVVVVLVVARCCSDRVCLKISFTHFKRFFLLGTIRSSIRTRHCCSTCTCNGSSSSSAMAKSPKLSNSPLPSSPPVAHRTPSSWAILKRPWHYWLFPNSPPCLRTRSRTIHNPQLRTVWSIPLRLRRNNPLGLAWADYSVVITAPRWRES